MVDSKIISPWLEQNGFLPTQKSLVCLVIIPYYTKMISMNLTGHASPNVSEYPQMANHIRHAFNDVYYGIEEKGLGDANAKSATVLGW